MNLIQKWRLNVIFVQRATHGLKVFYVESLGGHGWHNINSCASIVSVLHYGQVQVRSTNARTVQQIWTIDCHTPIDRTLDHCSSAQQKNDVFRGDLYTRSAHQFL